MKKLNFFGVCFVSFFAISYAEALGNPDCFEKESALASLETAENLLTKARVSLPYCKENANLTTKSGCNESKPLAYMELSKKLISDLRRNFPTCPKPIEKDPKIIQAVKAMDCSEILASGHKESGVYTVWIKSAQKFVAGKALQFYCDMETDKGGWTVIQRRGNFSVRQDFYQNWETYKNGFGNLTEEFWFGNENIRVLCDKGCEIRFDLQDADGEQGFAQYKSFRLSGSDYIISISGYTGNVGDSMTQHSNLRFSTKDQGRTARATSQMGGWWYIEDNHFSNLNGVYQPGISGFPSAFWFSWRKSNGLSNVEIKVRPR